MNVSCFGVTFGDEFFKISIILPKWIESSSLKEIQRVLKKTFCLESSGQNNAQHFLSFVQNFHAILLSEIVSEQEPNPKPHEDEKV